MDAPVAITFAAPTSCAHEPARDMDRDHRLIRVYCVKCGVVGLELTDRQYYADQRTQRFLDEIPRKDIPWQVSDPIPDSTPTVPIALPPTLP